MVVNVDFQGLLAACIGPNGQSCHVHECHDPKARSTSHSDHLLGVATIDLRGGYLNGRRIIANLNLDNELS
ncbi:MAG: hypothetical protein DMG60_18200 [Acidobacteria bacterium]|nr:MAG: hypothetical protein DMG60_18200 [Acidobacteriota bacterium]